jgi:hypothetical protein
MKANLLWVGALMPQCEGKHMKKPIKKPEYNKGQPTPTQSSLNQFTKNP